MKLKMNESIKFKYRDTVRQDDLTREELITILEGTNMDMFTEEEVPSEYESYLDTGSKLQRHGYISRDFMLKIFDEFKKSSNIDDTKMNYIKGRGNSSIIHYFETNEGRLVACEDFYREDNYLDSKVLRNYLYLMAQGYPHFEKWLKDNPNYLSKRRVKSVIDNILNISGRCIGIIDYLSTITESKPSYAKFDEYLQEQKDIARELGLEVVEQYGIKNPKLLVAIDFYKDDKKVMRIHNYGNQNLEYLETGVRFLNEAEELKGIQGILNKFLETLTSNKANEDIKDRYGIQGGIYFNEALSKEINADVLGIAAINSISEVVCLPHLVIDKDSKYGYYKEKRYANIVDYSEVIEELEEKGLFNGNAGMLETIRRAVEKIDENPEKYVLHKSLSKSIASENMKHYFDRLFTIEKEKKKRGSWVNEDRLSW